MHAMTWQRTQVLLLSLHSAIDTRHVPDVNIYSFCQKIFARYCIIFALHFAEKSNVVVKLSLVDNLFYFVLLILVSLIEFSSRLCCKRQGNRIFPFVILCVITGKIRLIFKRIAVRVWRIVHSNLNAKLGPFDDGNSRFKILINMPAPRCPPQVWFYSPVLNN